QWAQQMRAALLLLHADVEVADHHDTALGANVLLASAELARSHVALHDVDAVLLVEGDAAHFIEADDVVLADQAALPRSVVHEHLGDSRLAARDEVRIRRDLLEQVALSGSARTELDEIVVALHERDHAKDRDAFGALAE